jgi:ribosome biogenesis GTPase
LCQIKIDEFVVDAADGIETTFDDIYFLSSSCKFKDCTHTSETGCAVLQAVAHGQIDRKSYENYLKMVREKAYFESTVAERRKKDKNFGKMMKNYKKEKKKNKF